MSIGGSISFTGFGRVEAMFRNIAIRVPDHAARTMQSAARTVVELAQIYVPEDEGHLRNSIRIAKSYGARGRVEIQVVVGGQMVTKHNGREINLDQYALMIHENYESVEPGENTLAKMQANPRHKIGSQFLFRALEKVKEQIASKMIVAIEQVIHSEGGGR